MTWHGTTNGYTNYGCRCTVCCDANTAASLSWRSRNGRLGIHGPREPRHGTRTEYVKHRCRCDECRAAETAYRSRYRTARR